jgi:hypothetical protein
MSGSQKGNIDLWDESGAYWEDVHGRCMTRS